MANPMPKEGVSKLVCAILDKSVGIRNIKSSKWIEGNKQLSERVGDSNGLLSEWQKGLITKSLSECMKWIVKLS